MTEMFLEQKFDRDRVLNWCQAKICFFSHGIMNNVDRIACHHFSSQKGIAPADHCQGDGEGIVAQRKAKVLQNRSSYDS